MAENLNVVSCFMQVNTNYRAKMHRRRIRTTPAIVRAVEMRCLIFPQNILNFRIGAKPLPMISLFANHVI